MYRYEKFGLETISKILDTPTVINRYQYDEQKCAVDTFQSTMGSAENVKPITTINRKHRVWQTRESTLLLLIMNTLKIFVNGLHSS